MRLLRAAGAAASLGAAALAAAPHPAYREGAPPGFSGGFGESTCHACHFSGEPNDGVGALRVDAPDGSYAPGRGYPVTITLARPGLAAAGFQLTARFAAGGAQAGTLSRDPADAERVAVAIDRDVSYASQRRAGSTPTSRDTARWVVHWTAPATGGAVVFHVSANAADGDGTASGDHVYTAEIATAPDAAGSR